ncbi:MAG: winged helix-turn-helix transcriptional regulator [Parcubacteria group bacterium]|nr:winged helix-turn-helix transcriptional regulator [Parcubacteria group bacterium]
MKRWSVIYKTLGNMSRLKIIKLLSTNQPLSVGDIAEKINISFKGTSKHLVYLQGLGVLDAEGTKGHVYYFIDKSMPKDFRKAINLFL